MYRRIKKLIMIVSICLVLSYIGYKILNAPRYIILPIESPQSYLPRGEWFYNSFSVYRFPGQNDRYFVWRAETYVRSTAQDPKSPYDSLESVRDYFDKQLSHRDWELYESGIEDPCAPFLPESHFLPKGLDGYLIYRRPGAKPYSATPTICLAIWLDNPGGFETFNIVIVTINPSLLTIFEDQWDSMGLVRRTGP
jgi:hypothetical protein